MAGIKLPKMKKKSITKKITNVEMPKFIYIPLVSQNDDNITTLVKIGERVKKGQIIGRRKGQLSIPIHSSVSGKLLRFEEHYYLNGRKVKCAVIENDFKETLFERKINKKDISDYSKSHFISILKECGIIGLGGAGFPTYVKYDTNDKINTLIVNAVECEPYITSDYIAIREHVEDILEAIEAIIKINNIDEAIIAVKSDDINIQNAFKDFIGTYINIKMKLVKSKYPAGWERSIIKEVKNVEYRKLPIEKGIVVNNVSTIFAIYEALKYGKPLIERIITFTGPALKKPQNVKVKIGYPINVIIESIGGYQKIDEITLIAGGPMMGMSIANDDLIVTANLNCVIALPKMNYEPIECMRCGNCVKYCPAKLAPVLIKDQKFNLKELKELHPERCIECGICSYVCPSRIAIREIVKYAKNKVKEDSK